MGVFRQFPYSNFHEMNMDEIIKIIKNMLEEWAQYHAEWDRWMADLEASWTEYQDDVNAQWAAYQNTMNTAWQSMQNFINNYFDNLDVQEEINNKIISMIQTGEFGLLVNEYIPPAVNAWLNANITQPTGVVIDTSLTVAGACADAKATGDKISNLWNEFRSDFNNCFDKILGKNRVNSAEIENGYLNSSGALVQYSDWKSTGLCDVRGLSNIVASGSRVGESPSTRYAISLFFLCTYDSDKNFIAQIDTGSATTWTIASEVAYVRFSIHSDEFENIMLERGTTPTAHYEAYTINYNLKDACIADVVNEVDDLSNRFDIFYSKNRNPNNDTVGYLLSDGSIGSAGDWKTTDYCYVADLESIIGSSSKIGEPETSRYPLGLHFLCSYDSDKNFIEQIYISGQSTWVVTSETAYVRFCYHSDEDENVMLADESYIAPFVEYYRKIMLKPQYYDSSGDMKWAGKKWAAVGDSLTEANSRTNVHYYDYISEATGITVNVMGSSGTGYARGQDENKAFYQRISSVPTDSDVVTIFGSFNDLGSGLNLGTATDSGTTTIGGCINTTLDNLFAAYPLAQVGIVTPPPWIDANPLTEPNTASAYVSLIKEICSRRSIPCLDMFHESLLRPWESSFRALAYSKDDGNGVHPDETGHKIMAPRFNAFLNELLI